MGLNEIKGTQRDVVEYIKPISQGIVLHFSTKCYFQPFQLFYIQIFTLNSTISLLVHLTAGLKTLTSPTEPDKY